MPVKTKVVELPTGEQDANKKWKEDAEHDVWNKPAVADVAKVNELRQKYGTKDSVMKYGTEFIAKWHKDTEGGLKAQAAIIVALRSKITVPGKNVPDWGGSTQEYQRAAEKMYRDAGIPAARYGGIRDALRYHVQNLYVKVATPKELEVLGLNPVSRAERQNEAQRKRAAQKKQREEEAEAAKKKAEADAAKIKRLETKVEKITKAPPKAEPTDNPVTLARNLLMFAEQLQKLVAKNSVPVKDREKFGEHLGKALDTIEAIMQAVTATMVAETEQAEAERKSA